MEALKATTEDWIGSVPESWGLERMRYSLNEINVKNSPIKTEQILSLVKDKGVMLYEEKGDVGNKAKEDITGYKVAFPNTLIVNSMNILIGSVGISNYKGCVSPVYYVFKETEKSDLRYINYIFNTREFQKELRKYANGILEIRLRVSATDIFNRKIPMPTKDEQTRIADFLDEKCAEIDKLSEDIQKQIDELGSYKKTIVTKTIKIGLNEGAATVDSGAKWIGRISVHHPLIKLKYVADILDKYRKPIEASKRSQNAEVLYPYFGASGAIDLIDGYTIDDHVLLVGEDGANLKMRNLPLVYESKGKAWINNHAHILKPKKTCDFYYLFYAIEGADINPYITGSAQPKLSQENLINILIPLPDLETQRSISSYLVKKCTQIDDVVKVKQAQLDKLFEYKKSIIYEYVTGKKRVKGAL